MAGAFYAVAFEGATDHVIAVRLGERLTFSTSQAAIREVLGRRAAMHTARIVEAPTLRQAIANYRAGGIRYAGFPPNPPRRSTRGRRRAAGRAGRNVALRWTRTSPRLYAAESEGGVFLVQREGTRWRVTYKGGSAQGSQHVGFAQSAAHGKMLAQVARPNPRGKRRAARTVSEQHRLRVARATLKMPAAMRGVMGGSSLREAERTVGRARRRNPRRPVPGQRYADYVPTVEWVRTLKVGDWAPDPFGTMRRVRSIAFSGVDVKGKPYIGVRLAFGRNATISSSYTAGERVATVRGGTSGEYVEDNPRGRGGRGGRGTFTHRRVRAPGRFARGSLRTVPTNGRVIVGHLKGERRRTRTGRTKQTVQAILTPKRRRRTVSGQQGRPARARRPSTAARVRRHRTGHTRNPTLAVLGANPPLGIATRIEYTHAGDGRRYFHDFRPGARLTLRQDGSVTMKHPRHRLWKLFPK